MHPSYAEIGRLVAIDATASCACELRSVSSAVMPGYRATGHHQFLGLQFSKLVP